MRSNYCVFLIIFLCLTVFTTITAKTDPSLNETGAPVTKSIVVGGGCFWCVEALFDKIDGVTETTPGYSGGNTVDPDYASVSSGRTGHREVVKVTYDPTRVDLGTLYNIFFKNIDPTDTQGQFCDKGEQYKSVIFAADEIERALAEQVRAEVSTTLKQKVATDILPAKPFYRAEAYHEDYYKKNYLAYQAYRLGCGRDRRLEEVWRQK